MEGPSTQRLVGWAEEIFRPLEVRLSELGYIQRVGNSSYYDRILGTLMGVEAVEALAAEPKVPRLVRQFKGKIEAIDLTKAIRGWNDDTRMANGSDLWGYEEMKDLFETVSFFSAPRARPAPVGRAKKEAAHALKAQLDSLAELVKDVPPEHLDAALDEALKQARPAYQSIHEDRS